MSIAALIAFPVDLCLCAPLCLYCIFYIFHLSRPWVPTKRGSVLSSNASNIVEYTEVHYGTVLHELVHNSYGPHNAAFYKCLDSIKAECEVLILGHPLSSELFNRKAHRPDESASTSSDKLVEFSPEVGQRKPRKARTPRIKRGRGRKLGGDKKAYAELPQRELARMAAERRMRDAQLCDTHDDGPDDSPPVESSSSEREHKRKRIKPNNGDVCIPASSSTTTKPAKSSRTNDREERKIIELSDSSSSSDEDTKEEGVKFATDSTELLAEMSGLAERSDSRVQVFVSWSFYLFLVDMSLKSREQKRLNKELEDIRSQSEESSIDADTVGDDLTHWKGTIEGPPGTPYEGGHFIIDITIPPDYPYTPPKMQFDTKIWHPNISSQTGAICLDVLGKEWSPALTIRTALLSIQALLSCAEPDDPQDAEVANMYKSDRELFNKTAKYWTATFACVEAQAPHEEKIKNMCDMGFPRDQVVKALEAHNWDETVALNSLLEGRNGGFQWNMFSFIFGSPEERNSEQGDEPKGNESVGVGEKGGGPEMQNMEEERARPTLETLSPIGYEKASSPSFGGDIRGGDEEAEDTSPLSRTAPGGPSRTASIYDDLSSLSTIISRDLRFTDDMSSDAAAATVLQKLEKQNKWRFRSTGCRLNILLVGRPGVGKSTLRDKMMRSWVEVGSRQGSLGLQRIYQVTDKPAAFSFQVTITESPEVSQQLVENLEMSLLAYRTRRRRLRRDQNQRRLPTLGDCSAGDQAFPDDRIHVCLFMMRAAPLGSMDLSLDVMKGISKLTNLIPVLSKVDQVSRFELSMIRASVRQSILAAKIALFEDWYGFRSTLAPSTGDCDNGALSVYAGYGALGASTDTSQGTSENGQSDGKSCEGTNGDFSPADSSACPTPVAKNPLLANSGVADGTLYNGELLYGFSPFYVPPFNPHGSSTNGSNRAPRPGATSSRMCLLPHPDLSLHQLLEREPTAECSSQIDEFHTYIRPARGTRDITVDEVTLEGRREEEKSHENPSEHLASITPSSSNVAIAESAVARLQGQVLQSPLILDQASTYDEQDLR
ncbi:ubiquitin-conjugating enzyme E2 K [Perkinsus chesapeaki]|uniref:E2 ubiquitin-conjugating enzyme n=1 Tax=Perkinsus chesapeaki TaxID=330153 RepID=A0A7J6LLF3_PERCH|nr:ubiquitin-conjugating enzyme E2 K [Perkinsus chesapeaki]